MPRMGETVDEGTVNAWHKAVGDQVTAGEPLLEIGTDKVDTDIPAPASGTLAEIRVAEGETVPVATVLAVIQPGGTS
jgi:pyruvate dehydrogenase E2 component (dihydrolipoamide acetyltransferase)